MKKLALLFVLTIFLACNTSDDPGDVFTNCTEEFVFGLVIEVNDANTGNIILQNVTVTAADGDYTEGLVFNFDRFIGAGERAGTYILTIEAEGYQTLVTDPIVVGEDECHVIPEERTFGLQPN